MNEKLHDKFSNKFKSIGNKILHKISTKEYINRSSLSVFIWISYLFLQIRSYFSKKI